MKYMFASDVHGSAYYCRKMLDAYKEEKAERLVLLIYELSVSDGKIFMTLSTGSTDNIKPELVMEAFCREIGYDLPAFALLINREEVYAEGHISLEDLGKDIG